MSGGSRYRSVVASVVALVVVACAGTPASPTVADAPVLPQLDLQLRNSGLRGGYLWLAITGDAGRWHQFGMAELICVTCAVPFTGNGWSYELGVFDESCSLLGSYHVPGGQLRVEIDPGQVRVVPAPPPGDWLPIDSSPIDASSVPCASP